MRIWIGTSGWSYPHWRGTFYPPELPARRELEHASHAFASLEVNRSFYSLLTPASCLAWREQTPPRFVFALKGSRFITHSKKLRDVETPLANFFASGPLALGSKLAAVVWQLPATLSFQESRLRDFFALLPRTSEQAFALASRHDQRVKRGTHLAYQPYQRIRHAIEPRHPSFLDPAFARLAKAAQVAIVAADSADWPLIEEITTDFMYVRLHGSEQTYHSAYGDAALDDWAERIRGWRQGRYSETAHRISTLRPRKVRDVFVYFDNDVAAHAPRDAAALMARLSADD
ncbi:MAG: hypothetical protein JWN48_5785 [Myxococcaceae bacterium]|nr:hypothetical protein [Myxococcaceae bacterium]